MGLEFRSFYRSVRARIEDPMDKDWVLHTQLGPLYMLRLEWNDEGGILCMHCHDDAGAYRFIAFTYAQLLHFPLEVRKKVGTTKTIIGFRLTGQGEDVTSNEEPTTAAKTA